MQKKKYGKSTGIWHPPARTSALDSSLMFPFYNIHIYLFISVEGKKYISSSVCSVQLDLLFSEFLARQ